MDEETPKALIFVVHGMGSQLENYGKFDQNLRDLRKTCAEVIQEDFSPVIPPPQTIPTVQLPFASPRDRTRETPLSPLLASPFGSFFGADVVDQLNSPPTDQASTVEPPSHGITNGGDIAWVPIEWHSIIHSLDTVDSRMQLITLPTTPIFRQINNDMLADVLFYFSSFHGSKIMAIVADVLNKEHAQFKKKYPSFNGPVVILAHSLGGVISFDLFANQHKSSAQTEPKTKSDSDSTPGKCDNLDGKTVTSPPNSDASPVKTHFEIEYPVVNFKPDLLITLGSQVSAVLIMRGQSIDTYRLPDGIMHRNIFHLYDPMVKASMQSVHQVFQSLRNGLTRTFYFKTGKTKTQAYRVEPLIDPRYAEISPVLIQRPSSLTKGLFNHAYYRSLSQLFSSYLPSLPQDLPNLQSILPNLLFLPDFPLDFNNIMPDGVSLPSFGDARRRMLESVYSFAGMVGEAAALSGGFSGGSAHGIKRDHAHDLDEVGDVEESVDVEAEKRAGKRRRVEDSDVGHEGKDGRPIARPRSSKAAGKRAAANAVATAANAANTAANTASNAATAKAANTAATAACNAATAATAKATSTATAAAASATVAATVTAVAAAAATAAVNTAANTANTAATAATTKATATAVAAVAAAAATADDAEAVRVGGGLENPERGSLGEKQLKGGSGLLSRDSMYGSFATGDYTPSPSALAEGVIQSIKNAVRRMSNAFTLFDEDQMESDNGEPESPDLVTRDGMGTFVVSSETSVVTLDTKAAFPQSKKDNKEAFAGPANKQQQARALSETAHRHSQQEVEQVLTEELAAAAERVLKRPTKRARDSLPEDGDRVKERLKDDKALPDAQEEKETRDERPLPLKDRLDYFVTENIMDSTYHQYLIGMRAHFSYWTNKDMMYHIVSAIVSLKEERQTETNV
ncbi:hypothetical protein BJ741DRAFT_692939 [Chytriomyces cf. hyalinus JEL632]|nr:hypothetical protein BJ741DRAFT_692939 [Chytriomyces cf. hyalinus JEL632]